MREGISETVDRYLFVTGLMRRILARLESQGLKEFYERVYCNVTFHIIRPEAIELSRVPPPRCIASCPRHTVVVGFLRTGNAVILRGEVGEQSLKTVRHLSEQAPFSAPIQPRFLHGLEVASILWLYRIITSNGAQRPKPVGRLPGETLKN